MTKRDERPMPRMERIDWVDSTAHNGWRTTDDLDDLNICGCQSVGFIVKEDDLHITIALSRATHEKAAPYAEMMSIPKVAIRKRKVVK